MFFIFCCKNVLFKKFFHLFCLLHRQEVVTFPSAFYSLSTEREKNSNPPVNLFVRREEKSVNTPCSSDKSAAESTQRVSNHHHHHHHHSFCLQLDVCLTWTCLQWHNSDFWWWVLCVTTTFASRPPHSGLDWFWLAKSSSVTLGKLLIRSAELRRSRSALSFLLPTSLCWKPFACPVTSNCEIWVEHLHTGVFHWRTCVRLTRDPMGLLQLALYWNIIIQKVILLTSSWTESSWSVSITNRRKLSTSHV